MNYLNSDYCCTMRYHRLKKNASQAAKIRDYRNAQKKNLVSECSAYWARAIGNLQKYAQNLHFVAVFTQSVSDSYVICMYVAYF